MKGPSKFRRTRVAAPVESRAGDGPSDSFTASQSSYMNYCWAVGFDFRFRLPALPR